MVFLKAAFTSASFLAAGLVASAPEDADAQVGFQIGGSGYGSHSGYGYGQGNYNNYDRFGSRYTGSTGHRSSWGHGNGWSGRGSQGGWHDTSHYDYHPTTVVPHGNHYHVQPGHYDLHRSGHYDGFGHGW